VRKWRRRGAVLLAPILLALLGVVALRLAYTDRALPGTLLGGTNVEGDAKNALKDRMTRFKVSPVTIFAAGQSLRVTPNAAGYRLDVDATLRHVLDAGRQGPALSLVDTAKGLFVERDVEPVAAVDQVALERTVRAFARLVNRPAFPGHVSVDPVTLRATVQGPRQGRTVDRPALERQLVEALRAGKATLRAPFRSQKVATLAEVQRVGREAQAYVGGPLVLSMAGAPVTIAPGRVAPLLRLRASSKVHTKVRLGSDEAGLVALIASIAKERDHPARSARFSAPARVTILDGKGGVTWRPRRVAVRVTQQARTGRTISRGRALASAATAITQGSHRATLPVVTQKPAVTAAAAARVNSLIGTFTTRYQPGQPRVTNIRRMARAVDGTVIAPNAQFSLNGIVGERTLAGGYVKAPFIGEGNKIEPSVGGGVSQFSTTMYNAAYFAGLRVDTHQPHSLYISRYPPGREATLNFPSIDLKWTNDTDTPVFVRTFSDATSLTVSLYGNNGGRRVTAVPGPRTAAPSGGDFRIRVVRTVRYADGHSTQDAFTTTYAKGAG
jgi:vancomycin resistance protein YoaR